ncbi:MAG: hypothetical protein ACI8RN_000444 [Glaciecola sp.]|jgi:hypothetical protein
MGAATRFLSSSSSARTKALLKAIYTATAIYGLLLARKERVAVRADIDIEVLAQGRAGLYCVATATGHFNALVARMNFSFHVYLQYVDAATRTHTQVLLDHVALCQAPHPGVTAPEGGKRGAEFSRNSR